MKDFKVDGWWAFSRKEIEAEFFGTALRQPYPNATLEIFVARPMTGWTMSIGDTVHWHGAWNCTALTFKVEEVSRSLQRAAEWLHERPFCVPQALDILLPTRVEETYIRVIKGRLDLLDCEYTLWVGAPSGQFEKGQARHRFDLR